MFDFIKYLLKDYTFDIDNKLKREYKKLGRRVQRVLKVEITDKHMENMSDKAKEELVSQLNKYAENIIKEANLIEEGNREDGANREITSSIVKQAARKYRSNVLQKKGKGLVVLKAVSAFSLLITGFLFDANGYQDNIVKLILFIIALIVGCVSTVLQFVKEG